MKPRRHEPSLQAALRLSAMSAVLGYDETLLYFVFHHKERRLREAPEELLREARQRFGRNDRVLIQCAIDLFNGRGGARLTEMLDALDDERFLNLIRGLLQFREIEDERRLELLAYPEDPSC